jgi:hypothetical protein
MRHTQSITNSTKNWLLKHTINRTPLRTHLPAHNISTTQMRSKTSVMATHQREPILPVRATAIQAC